MKLKNIIMAFVAVSGLCASAGTTPVLQRQSGFVAPKFTEPHSVVEIFLTAVKRGELMLFDQAIKREMIIPVQVEYVYSLDNPLPTTKVYSQLIEPIPVPNQKEYQFIAITATLSSDGDIIETVGHVSLKKLVLP